MDVYARHDIEAGEFGDDYITRYTLSTSAGKA